MRRSGGGRRGRRIGLGGIGRRSLCSGEFFADDGEGGVSGGVQGLMCVCVCGRLAQGGKFVRTVAVEGYDQCLQETRSGSRGREGQGGHGGGA